MPFRPRVSLRAKITLALLVTGLTSAVLVGVIARRILLSQINGVVQETSFAAFHGDVTAYIATYGSYDEAMAQEPLDAFAARRRLAVPGPAAEGPGARPAGFVAPFTFVLLDADGRVMRGPPAPWPVGTAAPADVRRQGRPIVVGGRTVAYAVPLARANLAPFDRGYLAATQNAVAWGVLGAGALALALGFFFSHRLSANLRTLTHAIEAMRAGELRQHVRVGTRDEVGFLADAFNRMSATIREQAERLRELGLRDELTQLHNRRYFDEQAAVAFSQAQRYARPLAVALLDVDRFKQINDAHSHAIGDQVLTQVARLLADDRRESDILARYGGEEFVLAFPETGLAEAVATCERIRCHVADYPWDALQPGLAVTVTIGVDADVGRGSVEAMLQAADARLYEGKAGGRNAVSPPVAVGPVVQGARTTPTTGW